MQPFSVEGTDPRIELAKAVHGFRQAAVKLEQQRQRARRVDGLIVGTGEADFTKGNTLYRLRLEGKPFQLMDVPGIEGDEQRYRHIVEEAVAKAHLVFYVNGTNKKPEAATAKRIGSYLRRGTTVCPLVNVRGYADSYEFDEDRVGLSGHKEAACALEQTSAVLRETLDENVLMQGHCVQGLLALSALALEANTGLTTIHPDREQDLARPQRDYLSAFGEPERMLEFSQIRRVADVLSEKGRTFAIEIVESNKRKAINLLAATADILIEKRARAEAFVAECQSDFQTCLESIDREGSGFVQRLKAERQRTWTTFFQELEMAADRIVTANFGDGDAIRDALQREQESKLEALATRWNAWTADASRQLDEDLSQAVLRLVEDVERVDFQLRLKEQAGAAHGYDAGQLNMGLSLKDWGGFSSDVGGYVLSFAVIGSSFPGYGTAIGALAGLVVGLIKAASSYFTGKDERIRRALVRMQGQIAKVRQARLEELKTLDEGIEAQILRSIDENVRQKVLALKKALEQMPVILRSQIDTLQRIQQQVEGMPSGTVQSIHR